MTTFKRTVLPIVLGSFLAPAMAQTTSLHPVDGRGLDAASQGKAHSESPAPLYALPTNTGHVGGEDHTRSPRASAFFTERAESTLSKPVAGGAAQLAEHMQATASRLGETMHYDVRGQAHWALGKDYKAQVSRDGFAFIPFLGSSAPQNYPVRMQIASVQLGPAPLNLNANPRIHREADRITIDRGLVEERYDFSTESVEQSFLLDAAGAGQDLVVTLDVETELAWKDLPDGIMFENERGGVAYRHAVAIDGRGKELSLPIIAKEGQVEIKVPASFLAEAVNPILVDPIYYTVNVFNASTSNLLGSDVAFESTFGAYVFTHYSIFSLTDFDVRVESYFLDGTLLLSNWVDLTDEFWTKPSIASDRPSCTLLVAALVKDTLGLYEVKGRIVECSLFQMSPPFYIAFSGPSAYENIDVDVGGKSYAPSGYKVVWERDHFGATNHAIGGTTVTPAIPFSTSAYPTVTAPESIAYSTSFDYTGPRISKSSGQPGNDEWRILFSAENKTTGAQAIHSARYSGSNVLLASHTPLIGIAATAELFSVDVSEGLADFPGPTNGDSTYCGLAHIEGPEGSDVWWFGMDQENTFDITRLSDREHTARLVEQGLPSIATTKDRFIIPYLEVDSILNTILCYYTVIDPLNVPRFGISERRLFVGEMGPGVASGAPGAASAFSGGHYWSAAFGLSLDVQGPTEWDTLGVLSHTFPTGTPGHQYCFGNPNSTGDYGFITLLGNAGTTDAKVLGVEALPLGQFGFFLSSQGGFAMTTPPGSAGPLCIIGGDLGRYNQGAEIFQTGTTGTAHLTIDPGALRGPNGSVVATAGSTWNFQAWHRENGGVSNFTNAISLLFE